jgi:hypothetical protein
MFNLISVPAFDATGATIVTRGGVSSVLDSKLGLIAKDKK